MTERLKSPAELRSMFSENLKTLARKYRSISELSRQLGINRTQFNRYLSGESFPRPDVLARICHFFEVDARILLEPVSEIKTDADPLTSDFLKDFLGSGIEQITDEEFPAGFYRFSRPSFVDDTKFATGLVHVKRLNNCTYIRGYEAKEAMAQQGLPTHATTREFRGLVMRQEDGIAAVISRRNAMTCSFNYLTRVSSFQNNYWVGYCTRTTRESVTGTRVVRVVFEHIKHDMEVALQTARTAGLVPVESLVQFHRRLLQPDQPFR